MKRETLFNAVNNISDEYLQETIDELYSPCAGNTRKAERFMKKKKLIKAACTISVLALTGVGSIAYAANTFFHTTHGKPAENEVYSMKAYVTDDMGNTELVENPFIDPKYAFKFEGIDQCKEIEFKEHWLPFAPSEEWNADCKTEDGYRTFLSSEMTPENEKYFERNIDVAYKLQIFYLPQFEGDKALVLEDLQPMNLQEMADGSFKLIQFETHTDVEGNDVVYNYIMKINETDGYCIVAYGGCEMAELRHILDELEIHETGRIIDSSELGEGSMFLDPTVG